MSGALVFRGVLAALMVCIGVVILVRTFAMTPAAGFGVLPGVVLGAAMIGLGAHRISLILRMRRAA